MSQEHKTGRGGGGGGGARGGVTLKVKATNYLLRDQHTLRRALRLKWPLFSSHFDTTCALHLSCAVFTYVGRRHIDSHSD